MKLLLLCRHFYPIEGGAEKQMRQVLAELRANYGYDTAVVAGKAHETADQAMELNVRSLGIETTSPAAVFRRSVRMVLVGLALRPDVVIVLQAGSPAVAGLFVGLLRRAPVVIRLTGGSDAGSELSVRSKSAVGLIHAIAVLYLSRAVVAPAEHLLYEPGLIGAVLRKRGRCIPNGARCKLISRDPRGPFVWVGRNDPVKRLDALVRLADRCPTLKFRVVGPPIEVVPRRDNIEAVGWVDDPQSQLAGAAGVVTTSRYEGSPNSVLEALACGMPVAGFDNPGLRAAASLRPDAVRIVEDDDYVGLECALNSFQTLVVKDGSSGVPTIADAAFAWDSLLQQLVDPQSHGVQACG